MPRRRELCRFWNAHETAAGAHTANVSAQTLKPEVQRVSKAFCQFLNPPIGYTYVTRQSTARNHTMHCRARSASAPSRSTCS